MGSYTLGRDLGRYIILGGNKFNFIGDIHEGVGRENLFGGDLGRDFILGGKQTNLIGDFYDGEIKHFNGDCKSGFLFYCGDGWDNFNGILFNNKINGLTRITKGRTFLSLLYTLLKSDYISPSSPVSNIILLQLLLIPLVSF